MDDDEYHKELLERASSDVVKYEWYDCVDGFKQADADMGGAFHRKMEWMNKAADIYLSDNDKMAGFVGKFSDDCGIAYNYGKKINRHRKVPHGAQNFSKHVAMEILSAPEELRDDIVASGEPVTVKSVKKAKAGYKKVKEDESNSDLLEAVSGGLMKPTAAANEALSRAKKLQKEFNDLTEEEKIARLGGVKSLDAAHQRQLDETLEDDFNPNNAANSVLISISRIDISGGYGAIEKCIMQELRKSPRMQKYEAAALLNLANVINNNYKEITGMVDSQPTLKIVN